MAGSIPTSNVGEENVAFTRRLRRDVKPCVAISANVKTPYSQSHLTASPVAVVALSR